MSTVSLTSDKVRDLATLALQKIETRRTLEYEKHVDYLMNWSLNAKDDRLKIVKWWHRITLGYPDRPFTKQEAEVKANEFKLRVDRWWYKSEEDLAKTIIDALDRDATVTLSIVDYATLRNPTRTK